MAIFTGSGVALVTPFHEDESINYDKLDEMLDYHCTHGTDSIIICGTTGESSTLSEEEHMECIKFAIERVKGRIPVIAGTGSNSTYTTIQMSKEAVEDGADGLLLVTPYYNKCTQDGLIAHYTAVAKEAKAPIILYSVASRTGVNIAPETVATLHKNVENIVAVKEASGNISQISKDPQLTDGKSICIQAMMTRSYRSFLLEERVSFRFLRMWLRSIHMTSVQSSLKEMSREAVRCSWMRFR